jgi:hypothetical protein
VNDVLRHLKRLCINILALGDETPQPLPRLGDLCAHIETRLHPRPVLIEVHSEK